MSSNIGNGRSSTQHPNGLRTLTFIQSPHLTDRKCENSRMQFRQARIKLLVYKIRIDFKPTVMRIYLYIMKQTSPTKSMNYVKSCSKLLHCFNIEIIILGVLS